MMDLASCAAPHQLPDHAVPIRHARTVAESIVADLSSVSSGRRRHPNQYDHPNPALENNENQFHLTLPPFLTQKGHSLALMDQSTLAVCLQPVLQSLKMLNAETLLSLERVERGARLCDGVNVHPIHDQVYPRYDSFGGISCVRYIHITEVPEQYSIGIFVFPPFSRIPLHDHPEMCVLSRLLYGDLQCLSLDLPEEPRPSDDQAQRGISRSSLQALMNAKDQLYSHQPLRQQVPPGLPEGSRRAFKNPIKHLHAPDVSLLFPYKGNLHEFFAGPNGAAVLDILLPPYDVDHDRDCTFFDIREDPAAAAAQRPSQDYVNPQQGAAMIIDDDPQGGMAVINDERTPCWIIPTCQPHDFHCLSGSYEKVGANVLSMHDAATI